MTAQRVELRRQAGNLRRVEARLVGARAASRVSGPSSRRAREHVTVDGLHRRLDASPAERLDAPLPLARQRGREPGVAVQAHEGVGHLGPGLREQEVTPGNEVQVLDPHGGGDDGHATGEGFEDLRPGPAPHPDAHHQGAGALEDGADVRDEAEHLDARVRGRKLGGQGRPPRADHPHAQGGRGRPKAGPDLPEEPLLGLDVRPVVPGPVKEGVVHATSSPVGRAEVVRDGDRHDAHRARAVKRLEEPPVSLAGDENSIEGSGELPFPPEETGRLLQVPGGPGRNHARHRGVVGPVHLLAVDDSRAGERRPRTAPSPALRRGPRRSSWRRGVGTARAGARGFGSAPRRRGDARGRRDRLRRAPVRSVRGRRGSCRGSRSAREPGTPGDRQDRRRPAPPRRRIEPGPG